MQGACTGVLNVTFIFLFFFNSKKISEISSSSNISTKIVKNPLGGKVSISMLTLLFIFLIIIIFAEVEQYPCLSPSSL